MEELPQPASMVAVLTSDDLFPLILRRLSPADLIRAALACHGWCRAASLAAPRSPPLLGYFFHPVDTPRPPPMPSEGRAHYPAVFAPLGDAAAASPRLSLDAAPDFSIVDVRHGLVLLVPRSLPRSLLPRILAHDPASRRHALLPAPPHGPLPDDQWRGSRSFIGVAVLSRAHPSRLCFEAVCFTVDGGRPRAWVASVSDGDCSWRAMPRSEEVSIGFDPFLFERHCVHAAGNIYWHICNSGRLLRLDPRTLEFSFLLAPAELGRHFMKYRIGEMPGDGRLCIATAEDQLLQLWVRGDAVGNDNGWVLQRQMSLHRVYDAVPGLPRDMMSRVICTSLSDIDAGHTGKLFIETWGYGRYSFHLETRKLERLEIDDGKEYGDPIYAYCLAWPPAFLALED